MSTAGAVLHDRVGESLEYPLRRKDLACQPLFQQGRLIEGLSKRLKDGFHDVVGIATIHEIDVEIEPTVGHEGLEEVFEEAKIERFDFPVR